MTELLLNVDLSLVDWSRAQFALTAMFHWSFVPITLGILFIIAIMETIYYRTGDLEWKRTTKFWMKLFGINFAVGVATGLILEFEFGTNWSNYSWFVGDIFGAPLAIEGMLAFFMESTFIAVMFFGWNKVSKKFHLISTWLTAIGANLSALWILVANAWMQHPVGMEFNPDTARNEMVDFWEVLCSPVAITKFFHTVTSAYVVSAIFVIGVSSYFVYKKREILMARRSIIIASIFGISAMMALLGTGHSSAVQVAKYQPMKLAAMEGLYDGGTNADLLVAGILNPNKTVYNDEDPFIWKLGLNGMLSWLVDFDKEAYVPGINDIIDGNPEQGIPALANRVENGQKAREALIAYKTLKKDGNEQEANTHLSVLKDNFKDFGYYGIEKPDQIVPNVPLVFYSFHIMVALGFLFIIIFLVHGYLAYKDKLEKVKFSKLLMLIAMFSIPLAILATETGWIVAEVGRQPWAIQDLMTVSMGVTEISSSSVQVTFWIFAGLFCVLILTEISVMLKFIKKGPETLK